MAAMSASEFWTIGVTQPVEMESRFFCQRVSKESQALSSGHPAAAEPSPE
jgi:hypothetical protein